jgi:uncharacterized protein YjbI with pentapeptide repeats
MKKLNKKWRIIFYTEIVVVFALIILLWMQGERYWTRWTETAKNWWIFWSDNRESLSSLILVIGSIVGVIFLIWREFTAHRQANTAEKRHTAQTEADKERRITDNFTKAIELLGKPEIEVRLGAIYALERIAQESQQDHWPIMETLTAYVRTRCQISIESGGITDASIAETDSSSKKAKKGYAPVDVQAVFNVLRRRNLNHKEINLFDLSNTSLRYVDLSRTSLSFADLSGCDLRYANLNETDLSYSDLRFANFIGANLNRIFLYEADLTGAFLQKVELRYSDLRRATLTNANMSGADLTDADLTEARNISETNLIETIFCRTIMPDGITNDRDCEAAPFA